MQGNGARTRQLKTQLLNPIPAREELERTSPVDRVFDDIFDDIEAFVEERPLTARLLVGTVGATALMMIAAIIWATTDAPASAMVIAAVGITLASCLIVSTALPLDCKIGPMHGPTLTCRLQAHRRTVDMIATVLAILVIANIVTTTI